MNKINKKILVVEDEQAYQRALVDKLAIHGYEVFGANNGEEGLEKAFSMHPDLILVDVQMPKMDGIEMAKKIREDQWGKNVHIIVLTNFSDMDKLQQAMENNIFQFIIKTDIKIEDLLAKVEEALS